MGGYNEKRRLEHALEPVGKKMIGVSIEVLGIPTLLYHTEKFDQAQGSALSCAFSLFGREVIR